jgi:hypothetical protein
MTLSIVLFVLLINVFYAECRQYALYAVYHNAECRYAECRGTFPTNMTTRVKVFSYTLLCKLRP